MAADSILIPERFMGPPGSAQGGNTLARSRALWIELRDDGRGRAP